ncbi:hypothetical protein JI750_02030 [Flavobacterium sp. GN10]|uniref:Uncharacterized protein n=1 Tax=Flavobacterium tagetis TaxID=2801336 RepID=A0ABS1K868_9FLAO|nr:hypothetical protein [Flavobacterium tagetis]MBL0735645.1 hypothetical protein [Flavobacterium tagetis]
MKKYFLSLFLLYSTIAICQSKIYYLEGTLGKSTIFMTVQVYKSDNEANLNAVYFYKSSLKDIKLEGKLKDGNNFTFYFKPGDNITEKFYLKKSGNNFDGFWYDAKEKQLAVHLEPVNFDNYKSNLKIRFEDERLNLVKYKFLEFKKQKTTIYNNKEFVWYSEKHCDTDFFRLGNNFSEKNKTLINPVLEKIHIENTLAQLNCASSFGYSQGKGIEGNTTINFLNNDLLGFQVSMFWDCGGAHPDFGSSGYLIDLNNGKQYGIDDILAFDKSVTGDSENNFDAFSKYRNDFFSPKLLAVINSQEHFEKPKNEDDYCDYTNEEYWDFPSWSYTEKGIEFTPIFYRAARSCEEPFLVPFEKLKKYKNPKFPYEFK